MLTVLLPDEGETWGELSERMRDIEGNIVVVLPTLEELLPVENEKEIQKFFNYCDKASERIHLATFNRLFQVRARSKGIRLLTNIREVREFIGDHPKSQEALRMLSPQIWRQQLRSHLQSMGLLSLPKLRVWFLITISGFLLLFVLFRLMPSAEIRIWPRGDTVSQTANIFLVQSGAIVDIPPRVRSLELVPLKSKVDRIITFDQVSKNFIGTSARLPMTIINKSNEQYTLQKGSRLVNQAGMIFRIAEPVIIDSMEEITVQAVADDIDLYGEIIGKRGNVPANLKWEFPGLTKEEGLVVYGENRTEGIGGTTAYSNVLKADDLEIAQIQLKQELLSAANQLLDEQITLYNATNNDGNLERLYYDEFTVATYSGFVIPTQFIGEEVSSVPVEGGITYTAFAYDKKKALKMLYDELKSHVGDNRRLIDDSINYDLLIHHVIDYADDLSRIKLTVDLSGKEQYILDPLTPSGAHFAMNLRKIIVGKNKDEALRIIKNLPEVDTAKISVWPPWGRTLPGIPSHITVTPVVD